MVSNFHSGIILMVAILHNLARVAPEDTICVRRKGVTSHTPSMHMPTSDCPSCPLLTSKRAVVATHQDKSDSSSDAKAIPLPAILQEPEIHRTLPRTFAQSLLIQPCVTVQQLADLCKLLPAEHLTRKSVDSKGSVWVSGAYQKGGLVGQRANLDKFPYSTKCFTKFASSKFQTFVFQV